MVFGVSAGHAPALHVETSPDRAPNGIRHPYGSSRVIVPNCLKDIADKVAGWQQSFEPHGIESNGDSDKSRPDDREIVCL